MVVSEGERVISGPQVSVSESSLADSVSGVDSKDGSLEDVLRVVGAVDGVSVVVPSCKKELKHIQSVVDKVLGLVESEVLREKVDKLNGGRLLLDDSLGVFDKFLGDIGVVLDRGSINYRYRKLLFDGAVSFVKEYNDFHNRSGLHVNYFALFDDDEFDQHFSSSDAEQDSEKVVEEKIKLENEKTDYVGGEQGGDVTDVNWDWRDHGAVTKVTNQLNCGSCWAFAAAGVIESKMAIQHQYLFRLSPQQLLSCFNPEKYGCVGGNFAMVFDSYSNSHALASWKRLPYSASVGECTESGGIVETRGYSNTHYETNERIRDLVRRQPVAVSIESSSRCFQFYSHGILDNEFCKNKNKVNHAVQIVGYNDFNGPNAAWVIKNSWGRSWGRHGYGYIGIQRNARYGHFGVNKQVAFPRHTSFAASCVGDSCTSQGKFVNTSQLVPPGGDSVWDDVSFHDVLLLVLLFLWVLLVLHLVFRFLSYCAGLCCPRKRRFWRQQPNQEYLLPTDNTVNIPEAVRVSPF
uniref:Peptidase C1A papain C-terminal domain-containing protein n=1 Tax=Mucochytrium quahogii TaxID=96639 RepID=A0A7S2RAX7_9STRA|mmetsp:Transcript_5192/g.7937  ORF Transcript_5192/g.7937 Transcript_5192/m.7937 type:complete len:519 (+) Transcript_5192:46-1602(+)